MNPLAEKLRPKTFAEYIGQKHLLGEKGALTLFLQHQFLPSIIFYGPPGVGKTSLVHILADQLKAKLYILSAVHAGVKELKEVIEKIQKTSSLENKNILFIDEIHRFNKAQQDALLQAVEKGWITLIGATTENPSFEIIPALLSRCQIYVLKKLTAEEAKELLERALITESVPLPQAAKIALIAYADGDGRKLINTLEQLIHAFSKDALEKITTEMLESFWLQKTIAHDDEAHYDLISALIKSIRGSDADAAVYWLARLLKAGEDVKFIARRLLISAAEDIGLANPNALLLANQTFDAVHKLGMPEARIPLSLCTIYLANAAKDNTAYKAIDAALDFVAHHPAYPVPLHLRNAPTRWMKNQQLGNPYIYPHDDPNSPQNYLPCEIDSLNLCQKKFEK